MAEEEPEEKESLPDVERSREEEKGVEYVPWVLNYLEVLERLEYPKEGGQKKG